MPRLIWSPFALTDIQRLYGFLAKKDKDTARRAIKTIRAGMSA
ncbi:type II toxin-antitoxin system RelE/ParE family toxin [Photorhabdus akhurstii]